MGDFPELRPAVSLEPYDEGSKTQKVGAGSHDWSGYFDYLGHFAGPLGRTGRGSTVVGRDLGRCFEDNSTRETVGNAR